MCIMNLLLITILLQQMQIICRNFQLKKKRFKNYVMIIFPLDIDGINTPVTLK